jgi:hypothetical protein
MAVIARQVDVPPTTVVDLSVVLADLDYDESGKDSYFLSNEGTVDVELGGLDVATVGHSIRTLKVGRALGLDVRQGSALCLYVRTGSTHAVVDVLRSY